MTLTCETVRERLADETGSTEPDRALELHLSGCPDCRALAEALGDVDRELEALPPIDASSELVQRTIERIEAEPSATVLEARADERTAAPAAIAREEGRIEPRAGDAGRAKTPLELGSGSLLAAALAVTVAALTAIVTAPYVAVRAIAAWLGRVGQAREARAREERAVGARRGPWLEVAIVAGIAGVVGTATWQRFGNMIKGKIDGSTSTLDAMPSAETEGGYRSRGWFDGEEEAEPIALAPPPEAVEPTSSAASVPSGFDQGGRFDDDGRDLAPRDLQQGLLGQVNGTELLVVDGVGGVADMPMQEGQHRLSLAQTFETTVTNEATDTTGEGERFGRLESTRAEGGRNLEDRRVVIDDAVRGELASLAYAGGEHAGRPARTPTSEINLRSSAWTDAHRTEGLSFYPRDGWWQSTYVPGDPAIRLVHARLAASQLVLPGTARTGLALAEEVSPIAPPLDAPRDRALAVGAFADTAAIEGPTRVRVEVALRSIAQAAGRRGPLRVAVVLDADSLDADAQARVRALVMSLSRATTSRDRVALFASGPRGGELAPIGPMRAGRLEIALRRVFGGHVFGGHVFGGEAEAAPVTMADAVTRALETVSGEDGVGLVLVVTPDDVRGDSLERAIHLGTVAGITTSAIGVGPRASLASLDEIALAGQGRRRIVLTDDDALAAVRAELTAASELVARAVRVRVRLAEGVELVDVLGSRPLDAEESARTREVEQSIDQELARRLGILSDRDDDESGVRMLIPGFYANDAHSIVLDLVVSRPGHVLDVDVALKDLVRLGNARASASLTLPSGASRAAGPRELRVVADLLAHETALALAHASEALAAGDVNAARSRIDVASALVESARAEEPRLAELPSFTADAALLASFGAALRAHTPSMNEPLRDALSLAASRRLLRPRLASSE
jgi:hypothetical protein